MFKCFLIRFMLAIFVLSSHIAFAASRSHNDHSINVVTTPSIGTEQTPVIVKSLAGIPGTPFVVETIPTPKSSDEVAAEQAEKKHHEDNEDRTVNYTFWLTTFTVVLAFGTFLLWYETGQLRKLATKQDKAMQVSLDLARRSSDVAIALESPLFVMEKNDIGPDQSTLRVTFGNHGRTPAIITQTCLVINIDHALDPEPRYPVHSLEKVTKPRVVEYKHEYELIRQSPIDAEMWKQILTHKAILWVYGYLEYIDFLQEKRHMGFCFAFVPYHHPMYPSSEPNSGDLVLEGPRAYSYCRLVDDYVGEEV